MSYLFRKEQIMLFIRETYINATEGYRYSDSDIYESFTDDIGILFRNLQKEFGACIGKMYIDTDKGSKAIGWVFQKRVHYDFSEETYLREVWVEVHEKRPKTTIEYFYKEIA